MKGPMCGSNDAEWPNMMCCIAVPSETPWIARAGVECPPTAMHSFQSSSNAIEWNLSVQGRTEDGKPLLRDFAVVVFP